MGRLDINLFLTITAGSDVSDGMLWADAFTSVLCGSVFTSVHDSSCY